MARIFLNLKFWVLTLTLANAPPSSMASQYDPDAVQKYAELNRLNHTTLRSLFFCPKWSDALYSPPDTSPVTHSERIIVKRIGSDEVILNPENEPFGGSQNTLNLKAINLKMARERLGGRANSFGGLSCDLITEMGSPEMDIFHLDMRFTGEKMTSYRLRGMSINNPAWVNLNPLKVDLDPRVERTDDGFSPANK